MRIIDGPDMNKKIAFITGASRGIGAATARALAQAGYNLALTARTLENNELHEYANGIPSSLPGSLNACADEARAEGAEVLCLRSDILDTDSVLAAVDTTLAHYGAIDLLFNCACYQGPGNQERLLDVSLEQIQKIYQGNVITPLATVQRVLPKMLQRNTGTIINMVSGSAINPPPAPADEGGWGFAYPSSKAALMRMVYSLRVEHPDSALRAFNVEPGFVVTEVMKAIGVDKEIEKHFKPTSADTVAQVIVWLAEQPEALALMEKELVFAPSLAKKLGID